MAKKQVKAEKETGFKSPEPPKAEMNELANLMQYMTEQMQKRFNNQVFEKLNQETVEKFADAQIGNFANIFLKLAGAVKRKILKQFSDDRLEKQVKLITSKVNKRNKELFYKLIEDKIGINRKEMMNTEGLTFRINAFELETLQWVKKLRDENLEAFTANTLRSMAQGESLADVMKNFTGLVEKRKNHAKFLARTQIANFNSLTTKLRAENIGITKAVWVTSRDERVRASHQARDGKEFELKKGLYSSLDGKWLLPGTDFACRCDYILLIPGEEEEIE